MEFGFYYLILYFQTLGTVWRTSAANNCILKAAVDVLLAGKHDLRVLHIAGISNTITDSLSCGDLAHVLKLALHLSLHMYIRSLLPSILKPPQDALGAFFCWCQGKICSGSLTHLTRSYMGATKHCYTPLTNPHNVLMHLHSIYGSLSLNSITFLFNQLLTIYSTLLSICATISIHAPSNATSLALFTNLNQTSLKSDPSATQEQFIMSYEDANAYGASPFSGRSHWQFLTWKLSLSTFLSPPTCHIMTFFSVPWLRQGFLASFDLVRWHSLMTINFKTSDIFHVADLSYIGQARSIPNKIHLVLVPGTILSQ